MQFEKKSVVITGAASDIGHAAALAFARAGAAVCIGGLDQRVAGTVLHLCSDAASFTNGSVGVVDGGQTAH